MAYSDYQELLHIARENFIQGKYDKSEPMLKQLLLTNHREPEVYQMLATIFYEQGKFNKAIKTFERALEIDPNYTDASIGLSIILNDLGRYEEGKRVFEQAQRRLDDKKSKMDPYIKDRIAKKHVEIAALYSQHFAYEEAAEQYKKALKLSPDAEDIVVNLAESYVKQDLASEAIAALKAFLQLHPNAIGPRLKLGIIYYHANKMIDAVEQWEYILELDHSHQEAKSYIQMAQSAGVTDLGV
tara:strand:+ start:12589 stop:13314 length:726 start_codon:yes stop_codon:yes gene_type:complete